MENSYVDKLGGGWVRRKCLVAFVTGPPNWYWLTVRQCLLSLQQVRAEGNCCRLFCYFAFFRFPFCSLSLSFISSTIYHRAHFWIAKYAKNLHTDNENSDRTAHMRMLGARVKKYVSSRYGSKVLGLNHRCTRSSSHRREVAESSKQTT